MKKITLLVASLVACSITAFAQSPGPKARIFAKYDTNKNGIIDGDEIAVVRKAFAAEPKGEFATYDKDHDGKLSDEEIAQIKPPGGGGKAGAGKKPDAAPKKTDGEKKPDAK